MAGAIVAAFLVACAPQPEVAKETNLPGRALVGQVLSVDLERGTALIDHEAIPDYMPAMAMEFKVGAGDLALLEAGEHIRGRLIEGSEGEFRLEHIWPDNAVAQSQVDAAARALREDTVIRGRGAYREVGENLPGFSLYNQRGEVVDAAAFRGQQIMLNFIYTRCPIATMCPTATINMIATQKAAREAGVENLQLVSITLDPEFDTPGVLLAYAKDRGIDTSNFSFLTGPERAITDLLTQFGVIAQFKGNLLNHTLATLLIDANGRIIWRADGSQWDPQEFVGRMKP